VDSSADCTCPSASLHNAWCRRCNTGYIAGHQVQSALLFETVDPHGHEIDVSAMECESCKRATVSRGYCTACNVGFVDGMAYFTRLTYGLAQGVPVQVDSLECVRCRSFMDSTGWCDVCDRGVVGNVVLIDRTTYESTAREYRTLLLAIDRGTQCELCACAMVVHRTCPKCLISYESTESAPLTTHSKAPAGG
jgi:hypothetical protein